MAKKKGKKSSSRDKIPLESALGSDADDGIPGERIQLLDGIDLEDERDEIDLKRRLSKGNNKRHASKRSKIEEEVLQISDSDSDDDFRAIDPRTLAKEKRKAQKKKKKNEEEEDLESEEDEFEDVEIGGESWGSKKKYFYGGNANEKYPHKKDRKGANNEEDDDELDEAELEEEESKRLQMKMLEQMDEEDFELAFANNEQEQTSSKSTSKAQEIFSDFSKMSKREKKKLFEKEAPEFRPILEDFELKMKEAEEKLAPLVRLIDDGLLSKENSACQFIRTKYQVILHYCANIACYVMFKTRRANLKLHPITNRLVQYKKMLENLESLDGKVMPQVEQLLNSGGSLENAVKEARKKSTRKQKKKLRILQQNAEDEKMDDDDDAEAAPTWNNDNDLTYDERVALEMYEATRKKKKAKSESVEEDVEESGEEDVNDEDDEERRKITYEMSKNKGLKPKRSKLQRNPRVKHRHKFDKAKVRRKGQVREVRSETSKYGGEFSGINARVRKGIKLG